MNGVDGRICAFLVLFAIASTYFTYANFTLAFPTLSLELKTSKADVEALAEALANGDVSFEKRPLPRDDDATPSYMSAASFGGDAEVQHYVELAGGGNEAFNAMIARVSVVCPPLPLHFLLFLSLSFSLAFPRTRAAYLGSFRVREEHRDPLLL